MYKALEDLVQSSERFFLDVREARRLLNESKEAGEGGDWSTMAALARQGREELARALPEAIKKEIQEAKQYLLEAKARGTDVAASVKLLKDAGTAVKRQRYEEALAWLGEFKAEQKGL